MPFTDYTVPPGGVVPNPYGANVACVKNVGPYPFTIEGKVAQPDGATVKVSTAGSYAVTGDYSAMVRVVSNEGSTAAVGGVKSLGAGTTPGGYTWDFSRYPFTASVGVPTGNGQPKIVFATSAESSFRAVGGTALDNPTRTYYVNCNTGNDGNNGLTPGAAFQSIGKAVQTLNADYAAAGNTGTAKVIVAEGRYGRPYGFNINAVGNVAIPNGETAFVWQSGLVELGPWDPNGYAWTEVTTQGAALTGTGIWQASRTIVNRVYDLTSVNPLTGDPEEITNVVYSANLTLGPGQWAQNGGSLVVRRKDGLAPTPANTQVDLAADSIFFGYSAVMPNLYFGGGGSGGGRCVITGGKYAALLIQCTVHPTDGTRRVVAIADTAVRYAGGVSSTAQAITDVRNLAFDSVPGLVHLSRVKSVGATTDGINCHRTFGTLPMHLLTVGCEGLDNGRPPGTSPQAETSHEDLIVMGVGNRYLYNRGGAVFNINTTKSYYLGCVFGADRSDRPLGGLILPSQFLIRDTAESWADGCYFEATPGTAAVNNSGTGIFHYRDCQFGDGTLLGACEPF